MESNVRVLNSLEICLVLSLRLIKSSVCSLRLNHVLARVPAKEIVLRECSPWYHFLHWSNVYTLEPIIRRQMWIVTAASYSSNSARTISRYHSSYFALSILELVTQIPRHNATWTRFPLHRNPATRTACTLLCAVQSVSTVDKHWITKNHIFPGQISIHVTHS